MNMSNIKLLHNLDRPIGSRAINKFLDGMTFENRLSVIITAKPESPPTRSFGLSFRAERQKDKDSESFVFWAFLHNRFFYKEFGSGHSTKSFLI